ncbi:hypothetical protein SAMN02745136_04323 [Anaerocolumna jejuensis DSM 15929]|uniref:Glycosyl transferase family 2 n=1 Tax=Anaerocolumna jejuensis DSM 15929 TaxID=1121322 RepID=A0A1M6YNW7_9FIRM|nr:hypothetical protein [Anaerocolumna jejuensis]SHL19785.1 hypothetical protein SAMN02745136_04323 [Anaerocolumna jejuensis DSM 15929]
MKSIQSFIEDSLIDLSKYVLKIGIEYNIDDPVIVYGFSDGINLVHRIAESLYEYLINQKVRFDFLKKYILSLRRRYNEVIIIGMLSAAYSSESKRLINNIKDKTSIGIIVPAHKEQERMHEFGKNNPNGQNAFLAKVMQYYWIFSDNPFIKSELLFIDDADRTNIGDELEKYWVKVKDKVNLQKNMNLNIIKLLDYKDNNLKADNYILEKLRKRSFTTKKGGSILFGLNYFLNLKYDYAAYFDFDLTHPIEHIGIMLNIIKESSDIGMVINSRRKKDSFGYLPKNGQNLTSSLFQMVYRDMLNTNLTDINVGCKLLSLLAFSSYYKELDDFELSFDAELFMLCKKYNYSIIEIGGCFYHKYIDGKQGVARDYGDMLDNIYNNILKHNIVTHDKNFTLYNMIKKEQGFYYMVDFLEKSRRTKENDEKLILRLKKESEVDG